MYWRCHKIEVQSNGRQWKLFHDHSNDDVHKILDGQVLRSHSSGDVLEAVMLVILQTFFLNKLYYKLMYHLLQKEEKYRSTTSFIKYNLQIDVILNMIGVSATR